MTLFTTAYGRKNLEALSGTLLLLFLIEHLFANLMLLLDDPGPYRWYTETLGHSILVRGLEAALFALFLAHILVGLYMRLHHQRVLRRNPRLARPKDVATRFVGWTGAAILVFLVVHLLRFFVPNRVMNQPGFDLYLEAHTAFAFLPYTLFYTVCMVALALHLQHGIRSALFSFKLVKPSAIPRLRSVGSWVGFVVPLALAYIGVHLYVRSLM